MKAFSFSIFLSLLFLSCISVFAGDAPIPISFLNPTSFNQEEGAYVELRGFYAEHSNGRCILSAMPNLKSCCVGKEDLYHSQLLLKGDFGSLKKGCAISLKGYLHKNHEAAALHEPFYILHSSRLIASSSAENTPTASIDLLKNRSP